jgi:flavodoxin
MAEKTLIIYYSQARGNTKRIAEKIQKAKGFDIVRIETEVPYTGSYEEIVDQGQREVESGYKPKIKSLGVNISEYDRIIIGTPTWWYTMAPAVLSFLSENEWSGKTVIPFMTHGGWQGHLMKDIKKVCKNANVENEFSVQFDSTGGDVLITNEADIDKWIETL